MKKPYNLKGYALCRRPPLFGRALCGGGYVVLAHLPCWVYWSFVVLSVLVFLWEVQKQVWFWRLVFTAFSIIALTFDTDIAILGAKTFHSVGFVPPFYHSGGHFVSLGTPWGTMGAAGRTREGPELVF